MKKRYLVVSLIIFCLIGIMSACGSSSAGDEAEKADDNNQAADEESESNGNDDDSGKEEDEENATDEKDDDNADDEPSKENKNEDSNDQSKKEESNALSEYSSDEIEYARVWLQLGENQDIDELSVEHIAANEPLNPDDETSASYPEDVIQLAGSRLVDGSVTYSSNGDGTINVYQVPLRWDGENPAGKDVYKQIIDNTKEVSIDPGDDEKVEKLIKLLNIS